MVTLTNVGTTFDAITASQGLGIAELDFTNIRQLTFRVRVNKVGSGTQYWQLWNETDGAELALIADAGATGIKILSATVDLPTLGTKVVRVRARSTANTDDPIYLGSSVLLIP